MLLMGFRRACLLLLCLTSLNAFAEDYITFPSDVSWTTRGSDHFEILYRQGQDRLCERTLIAAEKAYDLLHPVFKDAPAKVWIVLTDFHDSLNGYAIDYPLPHFVIFAAPPEAGGALAALDGWLDSVVLHELVHVFHLYPANGWWSTLRFVFGAWVLPNALMPMHLHEGLATFYETKLSRGGRGRGTLFNMYRRMAVKEGVWGNQFVPLDLLDGSNVRWPQGTSPYFFGNLLYEDLWARKQDEGIGAFVKTTSESLPYFINRPVKAVYGSDFPTIWKGIFEKTGNSSRNEIAAIEKESLSALNFMTDTRFSKWDVVLSPDGKRVAYRGSNPDKGSFLEWFPLDPTGKRESVDLESGRQEGLCWVVRGEKSFLLFAESVFENGYSRNTLRALDVSNKHQKTPVHADKPLEHVQQLGCDPAGNTYTYQENAGLGFVRQWRFDDTFEKATLVREWKAPEGLWATALVASDPPLIALREGMSTAIYRWEVGHDPVRKALLNGHYYRFREPLSSGEWPVIGQTSGRDEIWALSSDFKSGRKLVSVLGGINAFDHTGDKYLVSAYRHGGNDIAQTKATPSKLSALEPPLKDNSVEGKIQISDARGYSPWSTLYPRGWIPSLFIVPNGMQISALVPGFDIAQKNVYMLFGGYDTRGSPFLIANYSYRFGETQSIGFDADYLPTYLISTGAFLKQWSTSLSWSTRLASQWPRLSLSAIFRRMESSALGPAVRSAGFSIGLSHTFWRKTAPRAIAPLRATQLSVNYARYFKALGSSDDFYSASASLDQYFQNPILPRHIFKLAVRAGITEGTVYYNSFFQGGGELVFSQGRGFFMNRGFAPGSFLSQRLLAFNLDYLFPIMEVERGLGQWPFFLKRLDGAWILDSTTGGQMTNVFWSTGIELKSYWKLFYYIPSTIRVGIYHGFGTFGEPLYITTAFEASL